jgi:hypothetical protein
MRTPPTRPQSTDGCRKIATFASGTRAREMQADHYMDEIIEIADSVAGSHSQIKVQAAKLATDARKWMITKLAPKKYGNRLKMTGASGKDLIPAARSNDPELAAQALLLLIKSLPATKVTEDE